MTVKEILVTLKPHKRMSRETLYTHLRALKVKPIGVRQSPQRYPDDVPDKILQRLGLVTKRNGHAKGRR